MHDSNLLVAAVEELFTGVLSDTLDAAGYRKHAMHPGIRPLDDHLVLCGYARTAQYQPAGEGEAAENPYELEIALVDDLKVSEVAVLACGSTEPVAPWGELLSTAAQARGAAGCITDGLVRDTRAIRSMKFPVYHGGIGPLDLKGRAKIIAVDIPVECGGVLVSPGDLVFGDADGVVVIPRDVEERILRAAFDKVILEERARRELRSGRKLSEVFARLGTT
jgi:4-hydroxy-4-methyl-2-oxoglutarate aldolase